MPFGILILPLKAQEICQDGVVLPAPCRVCLVRFAEGKVQEGPIWWLIPACGCTGAFQWHLLYNIAPKTFTNDLPCSVPAGPAACLSLFSPWALTSAQVIKILSQLSGSQPPSWLRRLILLPSFTTGGHRVPECGSDCPRARAGK